MKREEIEQFLMEKDATVIGFPDRGPWGDDRYRGNCSGWVQAFLIWKYQVQKMAELFAGSGTGSDVARDMGITYIGADLNPHPKRPDILSYDVMEADVPEEFLDADLLFAHPPYSSLIQISWAGKAYPDETGTLAAKDLGNLPWDDFMKQLNKVIMKYYAAMAPASRMCLLVGDVRRNGSFHSMLTDMVKPGELEQVIVKQQYNSCSSRRVYKHRNFVPITHEYIVVMRKLSSFMIDFQLPCNFRMDVRDSQVATWRDVVVTVLYQIGPSASLNEIYAAVEGHRKCETNSHWKEKIRQVLQLHNIFRSPSRGVWELCKAGA